MTKTRTLPSRATASRSSGARVLVVSSPSVTTMSLVTVVSLLGPSSSTPSAVASNSGVSPPGVARPSSATIAPRRPSSSGPTGTTWRVPRPKTSAGNNHRPTSLSPGPDDRAADALRDGLQAGCRRGWHWLLHRTGDVEGDEHPAGPPGLDERVPRRVDRGGRELDRGASGSCCAPAAA